MTSPNELSRGYFQVQLEDLRNCRLLVNHIRDDLHISLSIACGMEAEPHVELLSEALNELSQSWVVLTKARALLNRLVRIGE